MYGVAFFFPNRGTVYSRVPGLELRLGIVFFLVEMEWNGVIDGGGQVGRRWIDGGGGMK